jgi:preprotein translocase subunit SecG
MTALEITMMILLLIMGVFLVVSMLLQKSKTGLSGTIAGGADTYYKKDPGARVDRILGTLTAVVGAAFMILVLIVYVIQPNYGDLAAGNEWQSSSEFFQQFTSAQ